MVPGTKRETDELDVDREDRYRFPPQEEIWEVSCDHDRAEPPRPKLSDDRRRAS